MPCVTPMETANNRHPPPIETDDGNWQYEKAIGI
jgi:hypothetical protein